MSINKSTIITNIKDFLKEAKNESDMNKSNIIPKANFDNFLSTKENKKENENNKSDNKSSSNSEYEDAVDHLNEDETNLNTKKEDENEKNENSEKKIEEKKEENGIGDEIKKFKPNMVTFQDESDSDSDSE